jgi:predicted O-methyltransferase YrrM
MTNGQISSRVNGGRVEIDLFKQEFERTFPRPGREVPLSWLRERRARRRFDPCPKVRGLCGVRNLELLGLAYSLLPPGEGYLEVGTYQGKSLISTLVGRHLRQTYACDNFGERQNSNSLDTLVRNLTQFGLKDRIQFFEGPFQTMFSQGFLKVPIGLYYYDAAHDLESQRDAIVMVERILADTALVIVDDWRPAHDGVSTYAAKAGTESAISHSANEWKILYELPARRNGDRYLWWNGVGVLSFHRPL